MLLVLSFSCNRSTDSTKITNSDEHQRTEVDSSNARKLNLHDSKANNNWGSEKTSSKNFQETIEGLTMAIELNPDNPENAELYYLRGIGKWHGVGDYRGAMADFTKAIELVPNDAKAYRERGCMKADLGDHRGAIADFTKAIEFNPFDSKSYFNRGLEKAKIEDSQRAIADFTKAIELNPDDAEAYFFYYYRGLTKLGLDLKESGCLDLSKAGELGYDKAYETIKKLCNLII